MVEKVLSLKKRHRIAVAWAQDANTVGAINKAVTDGFAEAIMVGSSAEIVKTCRNSGIDPGLFRIVDSENEITASAEAVRLVRAGEADILMKGLVGTDKFLKAVMDKNNGLMLPGAVLSYVCALEIPVLSQASFHNRPGRNPVPIPGTKNRNGTLCDRNGRQVRDR